MDFNNQTQLTLMASASYKKTQWKKCPGRMCCSWGKKSQKLTVSYIDLWEIVKNLNENNVKWQAYYLSRGKWNENQMFQCCINIKWNGEVNDYSLYLINVDRQSNNLTQKKKNTASETFRKNFLKLSRLSFQFGMKPLAVGQERVSF